MNPTRAAHTTASTLYTTASNKLGQSIADLAAARAQVKATNEQTASVGTEKTKVEGLISTELVKIQTETDTNTAEVRFSLNSLDI